jgi:hypothetical protein
LLPCPVRVNRPNLNSILKLRAVINPNSDLPKNFNSSGSGEEKVVLSSRDEAVASLREEKLIFTGRVEPKG